MRPTLLHALPSDKCQEAGRDRTHMCTYNINTSITGRLAEYCQNVFKVMYIYSIYI